MTKEIIIQQKFQQRTSLDGFIFNFMVFEVAKSDNPNLKVGDSIFPLSQKDVEKFKQDGYSVIIKEFDTP